MFRIPCTTAVVAWGCASFAAAGDVEVSTVPTQAVYEYQLNYQLPWQRWYGGPGLSLGGTMPTKGVFGYSSLNGVPFPGPLGAGVYANGPGVGPGPNGMGLPGPPPFGPGPTMMSPLASPNLQLMGGMPGASMPGIGMMGPGILNPMSPGRTQPAATTTQPRRQSPTSSPVARRMSTEQQVLGDEKLRQQDWSHAYVHYRNAVDLAPERPECHFRLGLAFTGSRQYVSAVREFKRSLELDSTLPQSGEKLATIFGAESKIVKTLILPGIAEWANEELTNGDRLFLLGLMLHFADDPRGSEILEAALRTTGPNEYILMFLNSDQVAPNSDHGELITRPRYQRPSPTLEHDSSVPLSDPALPPSPSSSVRPGFDPVPEPPPT